MRFRLLAPIALLALTLSGCAAADASDIEPTEPAPATEPAVVEPTPEPDPVPTAPAEAFDGDCGVLATDDELAMAAGAALRPDPASTSWTAIAVRAVGGLSCSWSGGEPGWAPRVSLTVLPADVEVSDPETYCYGVACRFTSRIGTWWFTGTVEPVAGMDPEMAVMSLESAFGVRASQYVPVDREQPAGTWTEVPDCDPLAASADTSVVTDVALTANPTNLPGEADPGLYAAVTASGAIGCLWDGARAGFETVLVPGAGWAVGEAPADAEPVELAGAVAAAFVPEVAQQRRPTVLATDGANLMIVANQLPDGTDPAEPTAALASALLAAMN